MKNTTVLIKLLGDICYSKVVRQETLIPRLSPTPTLTPLHSGTAHYSGLRSWLHCLAYLTLTVLNSSASSQVLLYSNYTTKFTVWVVHLACIIIFVVVYPSLLKEITTPSHQSGLCEEEPGTFPSSSPKIALLWPHRKTLRVNLRRLSAESLKQSYQRELRSAWEFCPW
uniref:Uncharacterized protein n=1 Tax=Colobus angolensis palliatus TaxID=336983 RepID=A0A2K5K4S5_COLAP